MQDVLKAVGLIPAEFGRIDTQINRASITEKTGIKSHEAPADNFDLVLDVNVEGSFLTCKAPDRR